MIASPNPADAKSFDHAAAGAGDVPSSLDHAPAGAGDVPSRWSRAVRLFRLAVGLAALVSIASALQRYRHALEGRLGQVHLGWLAMGAALCAVYRVVNAYGWVLVLRSLGAPIRGVVGVRIWLVSETLRWLPGSVWGLFSRAAQATTAGVPAVTASLSLPLELTLTIASWTIAAFAGVGLSGAAGAWIARLPSSWIAACGLGLGVSVGAAFVLARWLPSTASSRKLQRLRESLRQLRTCRPRLSLLVATMVFFTGLCFLNGAAFFLVIRAVSDSPPAWLAAVGVNAAGWLLGFFAFFAPAGLGVREGGMAAMLAPLMPFDAAVAGVLLWRLIQIVVELLCLAACFVPTATSAARRLAARRWAVTQ